MIKKLRRKFILIAALCLLLVEVLIIGSINIINIVRISRDENQILELLSENDGKFPEFFKHGKGETMPPPDEDEKEMREHDELHKSFNAETKYQTRYFTVSYDKYGSLERIDTGHIAAVSSSDAICYAEDAAEKGGQNQYIKNYKYTISERKDGGLLYIFLDCQKDIATKNSFLAISVSIAVTGYFLVCTMIIIFSKRAVKPFREGYEKQRRFVTDAGHEIKTPLAIISANTEVIEMISEPSEWTESIKNQITRLDGLIANLMSLARMEENSVKYTFREFDLSSAANDTIDPFITLADTKGKVLESDIESGIFYTGDEGAVRQLISILVENAVKYCDDGGFIRVELYKTAKGKSIKLEVINSCENPPEGDLSKLFDRFYRYDESRSRDDGEPKSGYGVGLSIAKAVCEVHKGKISAKTDKGNITFTAVFKI